MTAPLTATKGGTQRSHEAITQRQAASCPERPLPPAPPRFTAVHRGSAGTVAARRLHSPLPLPSSCRCRWTPAPALPHTRLLGPSPCSQKREEEMTERRMFLMRMRAHDAHNAVLPRARPIFCFSFPLGSLKAGSYLASYQSRATGMHRDCHGYAPGLPRVCHRNATRVARYVYRIATGMPQKRQQCPILSYKRETTASPMAARPSWY